MNVPAAAATAATRRPHMRALQAKATWQVLGSEREDRDR